MVTTGANTSADRHDRLTPDQMPPEPVCDGVTAGHGTRDAILDMVLGRLEDARHSGREWRARCPAHDDEKPSLNLRAGDRQPVVITCRAGCPPTDVLAAIGLTLADISHEHGDQPPGAGEWTPSGPAVAVYDYTDAKGRLLYQVLRTAGKDFWQRRPDTASKTGWRWKLGNTRRVPYRLPRLLAAAGEPDAVTFIAEGERDVQAIEAAGGIATCNPGGAGNWRDAYSKHLAGFAEVIIIADKDEAGRKHAAKVAASLTKAGVPKLRIMEAAEGKDAADHLAKGHGLHDFVPAAAPASESGASPAPSASAADPMPDEPLTELGYAHRLVKVYGGQLRYVAAWRRWLVWDGQRWRHDTTGQAQRWMKTIARDITKDAKALTDQAECEAAYRLARRGESAHAIAGALVLAGTETGIVAEPDDLDADPFMLNCANGTVDLRTGKRHDHDPADLITKMAGAAYRPGVAGPEFTKFLDRVQPDEVMRAYLARLTGHGLEGRVTEHLLQIHWGAGANGKSTFIDAILAALGDYADAADPELLTARAYDAHPTGTADLFGLRLAILHESDHGRRLAEGTVKRLTGGDRIKARRMREDFWGFAPSHTFVMLTNHKPVVGGTDEGIWRRLRLVPWDVVIPEAERDEQLGDRLAAELDAVLAWLVAGYRDWRENGLGDPERVKKATADYRADSDALGRFIADLCVTGANYTVRSSDLFAAYSRWCAAEGIDPGSNRALTEALISRGYDPPSHTRRGALWRGLALVADDGEGDGS